MEFTTPLPWMHLRPASMTVHFDESIITGTRAMSGSAAMRLRNRTIAASESSMPSSMFTSMICAPSCTCWRAMRQRRRIVVGLDELAELGRARDVGALTHVHEADVVGEIEGLEARQLQARHVFLLLAHRLAAHAIGNGA